MIQIQRWCSRDDLDQVMIQIQWWWSISSDDDPDRVMIQIQWWWSRSSDDPDLDEADLKMKMNWTWQGLNDDPDDTEKKTCADKLCRENPFPVKRECWCNCNIGMYSLVYFIYCISLVPNVTIRRIINVKTSCKFIEVNPPSWSGVKFHTVSEH